MQRRSERRVWSPLVEAGAARRLSIWSRGSELFGGGSGQLGVCGRNNEADWIYDIATGGCSADRRVEAGRV